MALTHTHENNQSKSDQFLFAFYGLYQQVVPKFREPITSWKPYNVRAVYLQQEDDLREYEDRFSFSSYLYGSFLVDTGFGTTHAPDREEPGFESTYSAWALFFAGFLFILPWLGAISFYKSRSRLARLAAILSMILLPAWIGLLLVYFRYGRNVL